MVPGGWDQGFGLGLGKVYRHPHLRYVTVASGVFSCEIEKRQIAWCSSHLCVGLEATVRQTACKLMFDCGVGFATEDERHWHEYAPIA